MKAQRSDCEGFSECRGWDTQYQQTMGCLARRVVLAFRAFPRDVFRAFPRGACRTQPSRFYPRSVPRGPWPLLYLSALAGLEKEATFCILSCRVYILYSFPDLYTLFFSLDGRL